MKKSIAFLMTHKSLTAAAGLLLAILLTNVNAASAQDLGKVVQFARDNLNTIVGNGQCTDLVNQALVFGGAKTLVISHANAAQKKLGSPDEIYEWGTRLVVLGKNKKPATPKPGYILQFEGCVFESPDRSQSFGMYHHTAIVEKASGRIVTLLHQNGPTKAVTRSELDLAWIKSGSYKLWIPVAK